jgi:hypothetical protein
MELTARGALWGSFVGELALIAGAGVLLGLASRIPGRERAAWIAAGIAGVGLIGVLGDALALGYGAFATPFAECESCFVKSLILAVPVGAIDVR